MCPNGLRVLGLLIQPTIRVVGVVLILVIWGSYIARYSTTGASQGGVYVTDRLFGIIRWCNVGQGGSVCVRVFPSIYADTP